MFLLQSDRLLCYSDAVMDFRELYLCPINSVEEVYFCVTVAVKRTYSIFMCVPVSVCQRFISMCNCGSVTDVQYLHLCSCNGRKSTTVLTVQPTYHSYIF